MATEDSSLAGIFRTPADGGPRRWQVVSNDALKLHDTPAFDAPTIQIFDRGTVLSNLGCEYASNQVWCRVETIRGKMRGYALAEYLQPAVSPEGTVPVGDNDSVLRARKGRFNERGQIICAQERGQKMSDCTVGVARAGGGDAAVVVSFSNGFKRTLYFLNGEFISADATMSGSGSDTDWQKEGDVYFIRVDDQRYELHHKLIFGY